MSIMSEKAEDLRVIKTKKAIRETFRQMICEMDYRDITIKELSQRAMINRKTFYLHYDSLDDLLNELQKEVVDDFLKQDISYAHRDGIRKLIRFFFEYAATMPEISEKLLTSGSYAPIVKNITDQIMQNRHEKYQGTFSDDALTDHLVFTYISTNTTILYRQWVADDKKMPISQLIDTATKLICQGTDSFLE